MVKSEPKDKDRSDKDSIKKSQSQVMVSTNLATRAVKNRENENQVPIYYISFVKFFSNLSLDQE